MIKLKTKKIKNENDIEEILIDYERKNEELAEYIVLFNFIITELKGKISKKELRKMAIMYIGGEE